MQIVLPNNPQNFLLQEMCQQLREGHEVRMLFGGQSMLPLINGTDDKIELRPLAKDEKCVCGEVYLFVYNGHCIIHRLLRIEGEELVFRGDNCYNCERVLPSSVIGKLTTIIHKDGSQEDCEGQAWRRRGHRVSAYRTAKNRLIWLLSRPQRKRFAYVYFILLAVLMWAPLNGVGVVLNNYILGIRADHLLHASVYIPCVLFLMDHPGLRKPWMVWLVAVAVGLLTESVQYFLPYRGYDVNDLISNFLGATLGCVAVFCYKCRGLRNKRVR